MARLPPDVCLVPSVSPSKAEAASSVPRVSSRLAGSKTWGQPGVRGPEDGVLTHVDTEGVVQLVQQADRGLARNWRGPTGRRRGRNGCSALHSSLISSSLSGVAFGERGARGKHTVGAMAWAELRARPGSAFGLGAGVLVAAVCFGLLSSETTTSTAQVSATVRDNFRAAYDILVRPAGAETSFERAHELVDDGFLSGLFGGITLDQYEKIRSLPGVSLAAPVANVGYFLYEQTLFVPLPKSARPQGPAVFKVDLGWDVHHGLSSYPGRTFYIYWNPGTLHFGPSAGQDLPALPQPFVWPPTVGVQDVPGSKMELPVCDGWSERRSSSPPSALVADPYKQALQPAFECTASVVTLDGKLVRAEVPNVINGEASGELAAEVTFDIPVLVAGVDPDAEGALVGLKGSMTSGSYLAEGAGLSTPGDVPGTGKPSSQCTRFSSSGPGTCYVRTYPVIASTDTYLDEAAQLTVHRLAVPRGTDLAEQLGSMNAYSFLSRLSGSTVAKMSVTPTYAWRQALAHFSDSAWFSSSSLSGFSLAYWRPSATTDRVSTSGVVSPSVVTNDPRVWTSNAGLSVLVGASLAPPGSDDTWYRSLSVYGASSAATTIDGKWTALAPLPHLVGTFDPSKLRGFSPLSKVPLQTFYPPTVAAGDLAAKRVLGDKPLAPTTDLAGYLSQPPLLLTTIRGAIALDNGEGDAALVGPGIHAEAYQGASPRAPISTIQVRVRGVTGPNAASLAKIQAVAAKIRQLTGLTVNVTAGSSPTREKVALAHGNFGQPAMVVDQAWVKEYVAPVVTAALAGRDLVLQVLVLATCALSVAGVAGTSVRQRRQQLAVLSTFGWPGWPRYLLVAAEATLAGLLGAVLGAAALGLLAAAGAAKVSAAHAALVVPVGIALAALAASVPALQAARVAPLEALRPPGARLKVLRTRVRSLNTLAVTNLLSAPGRSLLALGTLALGAGALSVVIGVNLAFSRRVGASLLGHVASTQVRGADLASAALVVGVGAASVASSSYVSLRERQSELAALEATGWPGRSLASLTAREGLMLGSAGSVLGAAVGLVVLAAAGGTPDALLVSATVAAVAGCLLTALALAVSVGQFGGRPPASALAGLGASKRRAAPGEDGRQRPPPREGALGPNEHEQGAVMTIEPASGREPTTAISLADGAAVEAVSLTKRYGNGDDAVDALETVELSIAPGEAVALMGPSGSGKSTLLHLIGAMDVPTEGAIWVDGTDVATLRGELAARFRRTVGFVFQDFHLLPSLSALDNVLAPLLPFREGAQREQEAVDLLRMVGLADRPGALPSELSRGQQQRVAIARALINRPRVILADEPTGNLDSATGASVVDLLVSLRGRFGATLVLATHDQSIASRLDRVVHLLDGRMVP